MRKASLIAKIVAGAAATFSVGAANATTIDFYNGSDLYATLTFTGTTDFDLYFAGTGQAGAYVDYINLAGPCGTFTDNSTDTVASGTCSAGGFTDAGKTYNWQIQFPNANNASRFTADEHALFSIGATGTWDFDLIHINAYDANGNSIKLTGSSSTSSTSSSSSGDVPEPGPMSLTLLGLGLLGAGFMRRAKQSA
jgi:hypothetical protein